MAAAADRAGSTRPSARPIARHSAARCRDRCSVMPSQLVASLVAYSSAGQHLHLHGLLPLELALGGHRLGERLQTPRPTACRARRSCRSTDRRRRCRAARSSLNSTRNGCRFLRRRTAGCCRPAWPSRAWKSTGLVGRSALGLRSMRASDSGAAGAAACRAAGAGAAVAAIAASADTICTTGAGARRRHGGSGRLPSPARPVRARSGA